MQHDTQQGARSVLVRSDPDSGMALVQSKDGRTKWLTVSADPSHPSWDERVRSWAGKLGVFAQPSPATPAKQAKQATPLPTPSPKGPTAQEQDWTDDQSNSTKFAEEDEDRSLSRQQPPGPQNSQITASTTTVAPPPEDGPGQAVALNPSRKQAGGARRAGSFARGFLLGLSGGGAAGRSRSPAKAATSLVAGEGRAAIPVVASTSAQHGDLGGKEDAVADPPVVATGRSGSSSGSGSSRDRWVKGAPPSPTESSEGEVDETGDHVLPSSSSHCKTCKKNDTSEYHRSRGHADNQGSKTGDTAGNDGNVAGKDGIALAAVCPDAALTDSMAWLETGTFNGGGNGGTKAKSASQSKKKKKSKAKAKAGKAKKACTMTKNSRPSSDPDSLKNNSSEPAAATAKLKRETQQHRRDLSVTFGHVSLLEFTRDVGGGGVPSDGTWGLALGLPFRETMVDVDGYEASKAKILEERMAGLTKKQRHLCTGETRQFDYRPVGERNPLFLRLGEKDRSKCLLDYACFHKGDLKEADRDSHAHGDGGDDDRHEGHGGQSLDSPRQGFEGTDFSVFSHKVSHAEFVDKSQAAAVELTALRNSRRASQGCSCSYLRAEKLNVAKLRAELNKRGLKASGSKKELTKMLQEVMRSEDDKDGGEGHKVCKSEDCQCVRDGVECHADLCNCCKGPNIGTKDAHHGGNCGNPGGVYAYTSSVVRSHRSPYVTSKTVPGRERSHTRSDSICSDHH